jgi:adenine-specific DNA-methyltransferase
MARLIAEGRIIWPPKTSGRPRFKRFQNDLTSDFTGLSSVLNTVYSAQGTRELRDLFDGKDVLDFPKPVEYIRLIVQQATSADDGDIVLDFFAGSSTTAQAVLEANRADEGNRRFIMVQLQEPTGRAELPTVADIGKERIRRVIARMQKEDEGKLDLTGGAPPDRGFKVFQLRPSNYKSLHSTSTDDPDQYVDGLQQTLEPLVPGWRVENVIWEVAIKEGLGLNSRVEQVATVTANTIFRVTDEERGQSFYICLDDKVDYTDLKPLNLSAEDLFICRDLAMDDSTIANLTLQCRLKTI